MEIATMITLTDKDIETCKVQQGYGLKIKQFTQDGQDLILALTPEAVDEFIKDIAELRKDKK